LFNNVNDFCCLQKNEEHKEVKSEQMMENRGNPSNRGGNLGNRGGNRGFQRRDDNLQRGGGGARNQDVSIIILYNFILIPCTISYFHAL
jgi:hypothetical protein